MLLLFCFASVGENTEFGPWWLVRSNTHQQKHELHCNTETLWFGSDEGIPVIQSHAVHLSKIIRLQRKRRQGPTDIHPGVSQSLLYKCKTTWLWKKKKSPGAEKSDQIGQKNRKQDCINSCVMCWRKALFTFLTMELIWCHNVCSKGEKNETKNVLQQTIKNFEINNKKKTEKSFGTKKYILFSLEGFVFLFFSFFKFHIWFFRKHSLTFRISMFYRYFQLSHPWMQQLQICV